jgi:hypothetical protein
MATGSLSLDPRRPPVAVLVREMDRADPGARLPFTGAGGSRRRRAASRSGSARRCRNCIACGAGQVLRLPLLGREVEVASSAASGATIRASSAPW